LNLQQEGPRSKYSSLVCSALSKLGCI